MAFLVHPFPGGGGAQALLVGAGQGEDRAALGQVCFHPGGEFGRARGEVGDDFLAAPFSGGAVGAVADAADGAGDCGAQIQAGDVGRDVLLVVELAALPGAGGKHRGAGGLEAGMIGAGDEGDAAQAALEEAVAEGAPSGPRLR